MSWLTLLRNDERYTGLHLGRDREKSLAEVKLGQTLFLSPRFTYWSFSSVRVPTMVWSLAILHH